MEYFPPNILELLKLGSTAVVAIIALWFFFLLLKERKEHNNLPHIKDKLDLIESNHLNTIELKLDFLTKDSFKNGEKLDEIIKVLTKIEAKFKLK